MPFTPPGPSSYPSTFQPVLDQSFLDSLYSQINNQQEQDVGTAEGDAISRGITGSPYEAAAVGAANNNADMARNSALQGFLYNLAGMKENENLIGEQQAYGTSERLGSEQFQGTQNAAQLQEQYAALQNQRDIQNQRDVYGLYSGVAQGAGAGVGSFLGNYFA